MFLTASGRRPPIDIVLLGAGSFVEFWDGDGSACLMRAV